MRDAREYVTDAKQDWDFDIIDQAMAIGSDFGAWLQSYTRQVQSDASRSAARSERERCIKVCDDLTEERRDNLAMRESFGAEDCADRIRALPDTDVGDGEGEA